LPLFLIFLLQGFQIEHEYYYIHLYQRFNYNLDSTYQKSFKFIQKAFQSIQYFKNYVFCYFSILMNHFKSSHNLKIMQLYYSMYQNLNKSVIYLKFNINYFFL